jgi:hypothetical protein
MRPSNLTVLPSPRCRVSICSIPSVKAALWCALFALLVVASRSWAQVPVSSDAPVSQTVQPSAAETPAATGSSPPAPLPAAPSDQALPQAPVPAKETTHWHPVIAGLMSYQSNWSGGGYDLNPEFDPILLMPLGNRLLVAAEYNMLIDVVHDPNTGWGPAPVEHGMEYLQGDFFATNWLTIVAGRYLNPWGIYRERLHPLWIRNLQMEPIAFLLNATSGNGGQARGTFHLTDNVDVLYAGYYSAFSSVPQFLSPGMVGERASLFWPKQQLEVGLSYGYTWAPDRYNKVGVDFEWTNIHRMPLDVRAESLYSNVAGSTYWLEVAYGLKRLSRETLIKNTQLVVREEQYFTPNKPINPAVVSFEEDLAGLGNLPSVNTTGAAFGLNYYLTPDIRLNTAYYGYWATGQNSHSWNVGITYHFAFW